MTRRLRIYEINTRTYLSRFDLISQEDLHALAALGFNAVWLLGVWRITEGARKVSKIVSSEYDGSPFAIGRYEFSPEMGGQAAYLRFLETAHSAGLRVLLDFIPNHMALDSPWIEEDPQLFVLSNPNVRKQDTGDFFLHKSGEMIAFGRDPYFPPWRDTSQLDYTYPGLRSRMIATLKWIARHADGVRCDMAMLILRDYIRGQWYPGAPESWFDERMPGEFWGEALEQVKSERPDFTFLAECYWDKESALQALGFDLTYEKKLYDALVQRNADWVRELTKMPLDILTRSLFFIENHDEVRAASIFNQPENLAALALILCLPGSVLIHQGQMEGLKRKLPVQIPKPFADDLPNAAIKEPYQTILKATHDDLFDTGRFQLFDAGQSEVISFIRQSDSRLVAYLGHIGGNDWTFPSMRLDVSFVAHTAGASGDLKIINVLNSSSVIIHPDNASYFLPVGALLDDPATRFLIIEASTA